MKGLRQSKRTVDTVLSGRLVLTYSQGMWKHLRSGTRRTESLTQKGKTFSFVRKSTVTRPSLL